MSEHGDKIRIETGGSSNKLRALAAGCVVAAGSLLADKVGIIDLPDVAPSVEIDTEMEFEISGVKNPEIVVTGNICPVTVEGEVDVSLDVKQNIKPGIGGFGPTKTLTVLSGNAHLEGAVDACTKDIDISLRRIANSSGDSQTSRLGMDIVVDDVFSHGERIMNLGNGYVDCDPSRLFKTVDYFNDIGHERACGIMQSLGQTAFKEGVCLPEAIEGFESGLKEVVLNISNQILVEVDEYPIDPQDVTITVRDEDYLNRDSKDGLKKAEKLVKDVNSEFPDGVTFAFESIECGQPVFSESALDDNAVSLAPKSSRGDEKELSSGAGN